MESSSTSDIAALCGNIQNLTNPDYCGIGVLGSFTAGAGLLIFHQLGLAIAPLINRPTHRWLGAARSFDVRSSLVASSLSLCDTASVLSISWGIAAISQLVSNSAIQTTHDALMLCLTSYASNAIALGALCTTSEHVRRHRYRLHILLLSLVLCLATTGLADIKIRKGNFPMEACLPFFTEYRPNMRKYFKLLTAVFWSTIGIMLLRLAFSFFSPTRYGLSLEQTTSSSQGLNRLVRLGRIAGVWLFMVVELILVTTIVLVNHHFVPEQVLRAQAGGQLAEGQWTFGQIIGMLIWLPVVAELGFISLFGTKKGLEESLPISLVARLAPIQVDSEYGRRDISKLTLHLVYS